MKPFALQSVHWLASHAFKRAGFRWEVRRAGDVGVGLWRVSHPREGVAIGVGTTPRRLVLIPGFGDTPLSWFGVLALLQGRLRAGFDETVVLDYPGASGFLAHERFFGSADGMFGTLSATLDDLRPHTIVGHSLGGWVAAAYASDCGAGTRPAVRHSDYTGPEEIVLAAPSGVFGGWESADRFKGFFIRATSEGFSFLRPSLFAKEPRWFPLIAAEFGAFMRREDVAGFVRSVEERHYLEPRLSSIRARTWLIWGDRDEICHYDWLSRWTEGLHEGARAGAVTLPGVGHCLHVERPGRMASVLGRILDGRLIASDPGNRWLFA